MNRQALQKLGKILWAKWEKIKDEDGCPIPANAHLKWNELCDSLEIERMRELDEDEFELHGAILEESVVVNDPALYGAWVQIPKETALKILAIGMP
ncbi:hypothetical protein EBT16_00615 [bacterium]|nr:hypothetical protein [bacterium]